MPVVREAKLKCWLISLSTAATRPLFLLNFYVTLAPGADDVKGTI